MIDHSTKPSIVMSKLSDDGNLIASAPAISNRWLRMLIGVMRCS